MSSHLTLTALAPGPTPTPTSPAVTAAHALNALHQPLNNPHSTGLVGVMLLIGLIIGIYLIRSGGKSSG